MLDKLRQLNLPSDQFAIFVSGPLGIRNLREVGDIDVIIKREMWNELKKHYPVRLRGNKFSRPKSFFFWGIFYPF